MIKNILKKLDSYIYSGKRSKIHDERIVPYIELELSSICNAHCIFCPYDEKIKVQRTMLMEEDTFLKIVERIKNGNEKKVSFTPTTGETLTHFKWNEYMSTVLKIVNINEITFYSNAILLKEENQEKLIELLLRDKMKKIKEIYFSLGGWDRETYKLMYGVDKFEIVSENITNLLKRVKDLKLEVKINMNFRLPKHKIADQKAACTAYNRHGYKHVEMQFTNMLAYIYGEKNKNLQYCEVPAETSRKKKKYACLRLNKTRYAANGSIWADGGVESELPNDFSLKLGTIDDSFEKIEEARQGIIYDWNFNKNIPVPCRKCIFFAPDLKNESICRV